ncbi:Baculoviral IAP repeat-containing protein 3 [Bulinus truncatus]|nr:Baculoviral IAP repeat-containing protein 3 [Bulinus truncatus]
MNTTSSITTTVNPIIIGTVVSRECVDVNASSVCLPSGCTYQDANTAVTCLDSSTSGDNRGMSQEFDRYAQVGAEGGWDLLSYVGNERHKRVEMSCKVRRWKSFPQSLSHTKDIIKLANAGFYYAGYGDCTRCFCCGGGLEQQKEQNNVWVEHDKWFPSCTYLREQKCPKFIVSVQELALNFEDITLDMVKRKIPDVSRRWCTKCNERVVEVTYHPCSHMACYYCSRADRTQQCHVCQRDIVNRIAARFATYRQH